MNNNSAINIKETIDHFKKSLTQSKNKYLWEDILLFYRKQCASLQNNELLSLLKIGLKSLILQITKQIQKHIKKSRKVHLSEGDEGQLYELERIINIYDQCKGTFASYNRVLIAYLKEQDPSYFNMLFRKEIKIQFSKSKQLMIEPAESQLVYIDKKPLYGSIELQIKAFLHFLIRISLKKLKIFLIEGDFQKIIPNLELVDRIVKNSSITSYSFLLKVFEFNILKLTILTILNDRSQQWKINLPKISYQCPIFVIETLIKKKNKWSAKKLKHWYNNFIKFVFLVMKNVQLIEFKTFWLSQIYILIQQSMKLRKELKIKDSPFNKNLGVLVDLIVKVDSIAVQKQQIYYLIKRYFNLKSIQKLNEQQPTKLNLFTANRVIDQNDEGNLLSNQHKTSSFGQRSRKLLIRTKTIKPSPLNHNIQSKLQTFFNEIHFGVSPQSKLQDIICESDDENYHGFERKRRTEFFLGDEQSPNHMEKKQNINKKYFEEDVIEQKSREEQKSEKSQIKSVNKGYNTYAEVQENLQKTKEETSRFRSYSQHSIQCLRLKQRGKIDLTSNIKNPTKHEFHSYPSVLKINRDIKQILHKSPPKKLVLQKTVQLPKLKTHSKTETQLQEKYAIQLSEKYDKLSRMILLSNAGKQKNWYS